MRFTNEIIAALSDDEIFVYGSNEAGINAAGAAKQAMQWGAKWGVGYGLQGHTFAIPTKDYNIQTLPLDKIAYYVNSFIAHTAIAPNMNFLVTKIGCGLAGYTPEDIAPLFKDAIGVDNIILPYEFYKILNQ